MLQRRAEPIAVFGWLLSGVLLLTMLILMAIDRWTESDLANGWWQSALALTICMSGWYVWRQLSTPLRWMPLVLSLMIALSLIDQIDRQMTILPLHLASYLILCCVLFAMIIYFVHNRSVHLSIRILFILVPAILCGLTLALLFRDLTALMLF
ncbi:MAG: hypothetical protein Fur005_45500 [Roseiflexaceae bacterium]